MIDEVLVVGNLVQRADHAAADYNRLLGEMWDIVSKMDGFISVKSFTAEDGESVTIWRFKSEAALEAWRRHPDHVKAIRRGREEFYSHVELQICRVIREVRFAQAHAGG